MITSPFKKKIITAIFSAAFFAVSLGATGAGVQAGFFPALSLNEHGATASNFEASLTGTLRFTRIPVTAGAGLLAGAADNQGLLGLSAFADWWISDIQIENNWNIYAGFGASAALTLATDSKPELRAGARFFVGMNWLFIDNFIEFYVQQNAVPSISMNFSDNSKDFLFFIPIETGLRFHF